MLSSNQIKHLATILSLIFFTSSCRFWQTETNVSRSATNDFKNSAPFSTQEPQEFQTEILVSNYVSGEKKRERRYFVAKKGERLLVKFGVGTKSEFSYLTLSNDEIYIIRSQGKTIERRLPKRAALDEKDSWREFLTTKWLNEKHESAFEKVGVENGLTKHRVTFGEQKNSEAIVFVDEKIKLPTRQEFYSISDGKRVLVYSVELEEFKTDVNDSLFNLPEGFTQSGN